MSLSRRQFIAGAVTTLGSVALVGAGAVLMRPKKRAYLVQARGPADISQKTNYIEFRAPNVPGRIVIIDMQNFSLDYMPIPSMVHKFEQSPTQPQVLFGASKWATGAVAINLEHREILKTFESEPGEAFFGHGIFSENGERLLVSAQSYEKKRGLIYVYDTHDWRLLDKVPSAGLFPHELGLLGDNRLLIANSKSSNDLNFANVAILDGQTLKLEREIKVPLAQHFCLHNERMISVGAWEATTGKSGVYSIDLSLEVDGVHKILDQEVAFGEPLNNLNIGRNRSLISVVQSGVLAIYDHQSQQLRTTKLAGEVHSACLYEEHLYVVAGPDRRLHRLALTDQGLGPASEVMPDFLGSGPHSQIIYL